MPLPQFKQKIMRVKTVLPPIFAFILISILSSAVVFSAAGSGAESKPAPAGVVLPPTPSLTATQTVTVTATATVTPSGTPIRSPQAVMPLLRRDLTPTPTPSPSPSPIPGGIPPDNLAFEQEVLALINNERSAALLPPLSIDSRLTQSARRHARDMADNNQLSHTGSDGSTAGQRIQAAGYNYSWYGENIGWGFTSPGAMVDWWMNSPAHRANILHSQFTDVGVAYGWNESSSYRHHWVLNFGRLASGDPADSGLIVCIYSTDRQASGGSALLLQPDCPAAP